MWNLNDEIVFIMSFDVLILKTIIIVIWNTKILYIFSFVQIVFAKSFEDLRIRFFLTMLISSMRKFIFLEINTFNDVFLVSRSSFDNFDEWKQKKLFFREKNYFLCLMTCFFEKKKSFFLFFIETFCLDISIVTKILIVCVDLNSDDDVSSNVNNWDFFNDEIFFFIIDFETTFFLKLFRTNFRIEILSYYFSSLFSNICMKIARYVT
jgi:hypothetical protein